MWLCAAFCGLVLLHAALLHPPAAIEPAMPLRLALARTVGGAWLTSAVWLRSWEDAWLLMAAEGRLCASMTHFMRGASI